MNESSGTPQAVALQLVHLIADAEGKALRAQAVGDIPTREWILTTYHQCLLTVQDQGHHHDRLQLSAGLT